MLIIDPDIFYFLGCNPAACKFTVARSEISKCVIVNNTLTLEEVFNELEMPVCKKETFFFKHRLKTASIRDVEVFADALIINGNRVSLL
jgi:hypothetical protein